MDECFEYSLTQDLCKTCNIGAFLENGFCLKNPNGIEFCEEYEDESTCKRCVINYYLEENECYKVENEVVNCLYYESDNQCLICLEKYYLDSDKKCVGVLALNCNEYESKSKCSSCYDNYALKDGNCIFIPLADNCSKMKNSFPEECDICFEEFYLDGSGVCIKIKEPIDNCITYNSEQNCVKCENTYYLSIDKKCIKLIDSVLNVDHNCRRFSFNESPNCSVCSSGFYLENNKCHQCEKRACAFCDPKPRGKCLFCHQGYFMNTEGECMMLMEEPEKVNLLSNSNLLLFPFVLIFLLKEDF